VVAFFGDDWTSGAGASSKKKRFSSIVSTKLGLLERNFGQTGTGYSSYGDRVADVAAAKPDVVVVAGGRNDIVDGRAGAAVSGAKKLFAALHAKLPDAVLVAVAPMWGDSDPLPALKDLAAEVKKAVTAAGGKYLDIPDPVNGHPEYMADAADPGDNGYAAIADAIEPALSPLLPK